MTVNQNTQANVTAEPAVELYRSAREANDPDIKSLLHVERLAQLSIEPTSSCNLACVYCHFAPLSRRGKVFSETMIERIVAFVETFPVDVVTLAGGGEFTLYDGWEKIAGRLLDAGTNLRGISNFTNGIFDDEAVDMLSRFEEILVSLDTANPTLLKKTRYKADLRTMTLNIQQVRAKALEDGRTPPRMVCNAVIYDLNFLEIDKLAAYAIANGFDVLSLQRFVELSEVPDGINDFADNPHAYTIQPILQLNAEDSLAGLQAFGRAMTLCQGRIELNVNPVLSEDIGTLLRRVDPDATADAEPAPTRPAPSSLGTEMPDGRIRSPEGYIQTKSCLMPWDYMNTIWNGDVLPCCIVPDEIVGNGEQTPLVDIINSDMMVAYREGLLTGKLMPLCRECTYTADTDTVSQQSKVREFLAAQRQRNVETGWA